MQPSELKKRILSALKDLLNPVGYRKSGSLFSKQLCDVVHLIEVQSSSENTSSESRFTVNIGIFSPTLVYADVRDFRKPSIPDAQWRERLGSLCPEKKDMWWNISSLEQSESAALDIRHRVETYALPILSGLSDLKSLGVLWSSGLSPGITSSRRAEYLGMLTAGRNPALAGGFKS
jgi:Domain of unknown function (DUF4304)